MDECKPLPDGRRGTNVGVDGVLRAAGAAGHVRVLGRALGFGLWGLGLTLYTLTAPVHVNGNFLIICQLCFVPETTQHSQLNTSKLRTSTSSCCQLSPPSETTQSSHLNT